MYERMNIEDWKAKKKNDRDAVMIDQKQALQEVLQDGAHLTAYLLGRGRACVASAALLDLRLSENRPDPQGVLVRHPPAQPEMDQGHSWRGITMRPVPFRGGPLC